MLPGPDPLARRLDADKYDVLVIQEGGEHADRVGPAADARHHDVGQLAVQRQVLLARLVADHALQVAHHLGIGVRPDDRADDVVGRAHVGHPVADRLGGRVFQCLGATRHFDDLSAEKLHTADVHRLPPHVLGAHVDGALEAEPGADRGGRHAVLARPGFGDDPLLAHAQGEHRLADRVVELVRPRVAQVLALEVDVRAAELLAQPVRGVKGSGPPDEGAPVPGQLELELWVGLGLVPLVFQLVQRAHQRLRDVLPAEGAEPPVDRVRQPGADAHPSASASLTAWTKARILAGSLTLTRASTPLDTSTP